MTPLKKKKTLPLILSLVLLAPSLTPAVVRADDLQSPATYSILAETTEEEEETPVPETPELDYLIFQTENDQTVVIGSSGSISFRLYDEDDDPFTGSVSGYIVDPDGDIDYVSISGGGQGTYSLSNYTFDKLGEYDLVVYDKEDNTARGHIDVVDPLISVTGSLVVNSKSTVTVEITDTEGNEFARKSVTVDGTNVGGNSSNYTTLYDGTFTFTMTPTQLGTVNIVNNGHIIGTIEVQPAYTKEGRIGGQTADNAGLSVAVSQNGWSRSSHVILTRDDVVADAMVSVPLAKRYDAPILMTSPTSLNEQVIDEIHRLDADTVFIIGGTGAISQETEDRLKAEGIYTYRFAGATRYETAAEIAGWVGTSDTVYLAYGYGEPDALAASAFAAAQGIPILLTETEGLPDATQSKLREISPTQVVILGGTGIVSTGLENQLSAQYLVKRWGGADRYGTQQIILQNLVKEQAPVYITSALVAPGDVPDGKPYGNALLAAALAAQNDGFVITVPKNELPSAVNYSLLYNKGYISSATVVGNTSVVSTSLEQRIHELLKH